MGSLVYFLSNMAPVSIFCAGFDSLAGFVSAGFCCLGYSFFSTLGSYFLVYSFLTYCLGSYFLAYLADPAGFAMSVSISNKGFPTSRLSPALT
jgi:hypothetical protein